MHFNFPVIFSLSFFLPEIEPWKPNIRVCYYFLIIKLADDAEARQVHSVQDHNQILHLYHMVFVYARFWI